MVKNQNAQIIGGNLKLLRKEKFKMTQKEFSELIGMSLQNLSQAERGVYKPGLDKLLEISQILDVSPNDLLLDQQSKSYFKGREKELRDKLSSIYLFIETWEPYRAEAKIAREAGDTKREIEVLKNLFHQLVWRPEHWREVTDYVYYEAINKKVRKISDSYREMYTNPTFREKFSDLFNKLF